MAARPARIAALALAGLLVGTALAACGGSSDNGDGKASATASSSSGASATASPTDGASGYPPVPSGVTLTSQGTALQVGQSATVAWQPSQKVVGVLDVTVTALHSTTFDKSFSGWELDDVTKANAPYFVTATVRNAGESDLGGVAVPLYGAAATGALVEASTFATDFKPCAPGVLPTPFPAGASADVCLVYLVPSAGALEGVSFRPTESFDPITWTGEVTALPGKGKKGKGATASASPSGLPTTTSTSSPSVHMSGSPLH
jgi:hypothetical protein